MKKTMIAAIALTGATPALAQDAMFGTETDVEYAAQLWSAMEEGGFVGPDTFVGFPYPGTEPHGMMLETFYTTATIDGHEGALVIKRNYGPAGVSEDEVIGDPAGAPRRDYRDVPARGGL